MEDVTIEKELPATESSITTVPDMKFAVKKTADIDGFIEQRQLFIQKVSAICVEGKDYHVIQGKKSLAKGGAEKIASIFNWAAQFEKDGESIEMLGSIPGLVAFRCTLLNKGKFVGEGRGAAMLAKNAGDPNKTLKMAQKSAYIDAVIRASGLSDFFTQDLEDMDASQIGQSQSYQTTQSVAPSDKQLDLIQDMITKKGVTEDMLYADGFDLKNLTGGKDGTASELIEYLFQFRPQGRDTSLGQITEGAKLLIQDLQECQSADSYQKISNEAKIAKEAGSLTAQDWSAIMAAAKETATRLTPQKQTELEDIASKINF